MEKELNINGNIYRLVEDNKLEVGKWYTNCNFPKGTHTALYVGNSKGVGFNIRKGWIGEMPVYSPDIWRLSNVEEVEKLLIKEAEKRGFKDGIKYKSMTIDKVHVVKLPLHTNENHLFDDNGNVLFDFKSGQWAEIIEEKPLYTNSYGTSFFKGDVYWYVEKSDNTINHIIIESGSSCAGDEECSEAMTMRECHRYIDENWDKLNK